MLGEQNTQTFNSLKYLKKKTTLFVCRKSFFLDLESHLSDSEIFEGLVPSLSSEIYWTYLNISKTQSVIIVSRNTLEMMKTDRVSKIFGNFVFGFHCLIKDSSLLKLLFVSLKKSSVVCG